MPLTLVSHQFTSEIHFKIVRTVEARFTIMLIIAEILKINVRCCSSITNYARVRTLCSRCEFFARSRRASVVISCLREISTWTFNMKKKSSLRGEAIFVFEILVPSKFYIFIILLIPTGNL